MNVSELAKELNVTSKEVLTFLQEKGFAYKSATKKLDDSEIELVKGGLGGKTVATGEKKKKEVVAEKPASAEKEAPVKEAPVKAEAKAEPAKKEAPAPAKAPAAAPAPAKAPAAAPAPAQNLRKRKKPSLW